MTESAPQRPLNSFSGLWPFIKPHRSLLLAWLMALGFSSAATLYFPVTLKNVIDHGFSGAEEINQHFMGIFAVICVLAVATAFRYFFISLLGEKTIAGLRTALYSHLLTLDQSFFEKTRSGELVSRLSADTELVRGVIGSSISVALRSTITVAGSAVMMIITSPRLGLYVLACIPLIILPLVFSGQRVRGVAKDTQDRLADANARAGETLNAMHTVQSYAREEHESNRFIQAIGLSLNAARKRIRLQSLLTMAFILLVFCGIALVLWTGAHSVIDGSMSKGTLGQFVFYAIIGGGSAAAITEVWNEVQRAAGGMSRLNELFGERSELRSNESSAKLITPVRGDIVFDDVSFNYPTRPDQKALHNFSLRIKPGETIALVGPSGAGKSTVFQLLLRFHDPQQGCISLDGTDLRSCDAQELRSQIALVPQDPFIFGASIKENIRYGRLNASDDEIANAARDAEALEFIQALPDKFDSEVGERGARLSGGQQQRLAIARALLKDSPILLLDEATSALDAQSERAVQKALEHLMQGRTTLVIAHRLATVLKADRIIVLDKGRIIATGTHQELLTQGGLYADLAKLQFEAT